MNKKQKSNLARTAIFVLEGKAPPKFDMDNYCSIPSVDDHYAYPISISKKRNECGTSACFAGHGPLALNNARPRDSWESYIERTFGFKEVGREWMFLFDSDWADSRKQAASRALSFLKDSKQYNEWENDRQDCNFRGLYKQKFLTSYSNKKLIAALSEFVID